MNQDNTEWRKDLHRLQNEKGTLCLSIIAPAEKMFSGNRVNDHAIHRLEAEVRNRLLENTESDETEPLLHSLEQLIKNINFIHGMEGIGLFISKHVKHRMPFYFPVKEKIIVANYFDIRDYLYQDFYAINYHVLLLSKDEARLFKGVFNQLNEVKDTYFPLRFEDDYEYSRPSRGSTYEGYAVTKDFEKEKSQLQDLRAEKFLQHVDDLLHTYMGATDPLILTGAEKLLAYYASTTKFSNIIGRLHGNYLNISESVIGESTWDAVKVNMNNKKQKSIQDLGEKIGRGEAVTGIVDSWKIAYEGNAGHLLVEKDFYCPGYQPIKNPERLYLAPPDGSYKVLSDAVTALIELVQDKRGEVMLVENGALDNFQHIALMNRY